MEIKKQVYKGIEFTVHKCAREVLVHGEYELRVYFIAHDPRGVTQSIEYPTISEAIEAAHKAVDSYLLYIPSAVTTIPALIEELNDCVLDNGWGDTVLDEQRATLLINAFLTNLKG